MVIWKTALLQFHSWISLKVLGACVVFCLTSYVLYIQSGSSLWNWPLVWAPGTRVVPSTTISYNSTSLADDRQDWSAKPTLYITANAIGRLGNTMFQYASLLGIAAMNNGSHRPFYSPSSLVAQTFQLTQVKKRDFSGFLHMKESGSGTFDHQFKHLPKQSVKIGTYLQSWKYFKSIESTIRKEFTFRPEFREKGQQLLKRIRKGRDNVTMVGVHMRRGDYVRPNMVGQFKLPPLSFFYKAAAVFRARYKNILFVIFTTEPKWCRELFKDPDFILAPKASANVHLYMLTQCDHMVSSLGSFGWWGGYLGGGDVVYYNNCVYPNITAKKGFIAADFFLPSWTGIGD